MSYTITKTNGSTLGTILDGTINTTFTSLTLVGRNYANYGQIIAENFVRLVENFAYSSAPSNPLEGQLWWNTSDKRLRVATADGGPFKIVSSCTSQPTAPNTVVAGDLWFNSGTEQFYVYNGTNPYSADGWILIGPQRDDSGAIWEQIVDTLAVTNDVVSVRLNGVRTAIISATSFTPATPIVGFANVFAGWTMNSATTIWGTSNNASYLGNQPAANYFRNNINNSGTGTLAIVNNGGLTAGTFGQFVANISSNNVSLHNTVNGSLRLVNQGNVALTVTDTGEVTVNTDPAVALGVATKQYVDNKFNDTVLYGIPTAPTAPAGTANTMIATTEFVTTGLSGIFKYKIYDGNSHFWIDDSGTGGANLVIDGTTVMTAGATGVTLGNGATATTQSQSYSSNGDGKVATTQYVKTASTWWGNSAHRSAKWVSTAAPSAGVNDIGSQDGDIWFQREA